MALAVPFLMSCVSRSLPQDRFAQSTTLAAPPLNVTLADPQNFSFAVVGDTHVALDTKRLREIFTRAAGEGDAFVILLGDIVDQGDTSSYHAVEEAIRDSAFQGKILPIVGNHDVFEGGWDEYRARFGPSHYAVTLGNSRFLAVDTADGSLAKEEVEWLRARLEEPGPAHTFILSHYAPVVPGVRTYLKLASEELSHRLMKMASVFGVRGWLAGHYHSYVSREVAGVTYLIAGGGGGRRMAPVKSFFFVQVNVAGADVTYLLRELPE